jgi:hypothetical protein
MCEKFLTRKPFSRGTGGAVRNNKWQHLTINYPLC